MRAIGSARVPCYVSNSTFVAIICVDCKYGQWGCFDLTPNIEMHNVARCSHMYVYLALLVFVFVGLLLSQMQVILKT